MSQNIYDNPDFLAGYRTLPRSQQGLGGAPEWPTIRTLLPSLDGKRVLDLGCGFGWFSRWAVENGASSVRGVDISSDMLAEARSRPAERIHYEQADLDEFEAPAASADIVYSSLAFHYLVDFERLAGMVARTLVPGGTLVFSVEHPIYSATTGEGFTTLSGGAAAWPITGYLDAGERLTNWFTDDVRKYHRPVQDYVMALVDVGFTLTSLIEWGPSPEQIAEQPAWAVERDRPMFLIVAATS